MATMNSFRPVSTQELSSANEVAALQKEVARLRGLLVTILKTLPSDQHAHRARLLNTLSELKIFESAFVETAPFFPIRQDRYQEERNSGLFAPCDNSPTSPMYASLAKMKRQVSEVIEECGALRRALDTEQHCHKQTLAEITVAWGELSAILDREESKTAALAAERDELRTTLLSQGLGSFSAKEKHDELTAALQECEVIISRLQAERDALTTARETHKAEAATALKGCEARLSAVEFERGSLSKAILKQKVDAAAASSLAKTKHQALVTQLRTAQANANQLKAERDQLSSTLDIAKKDATGKEQALELSKKLVSYQNSTIEKHVKKQKELESSLAVADILKTQLNNDIKQLTERSNVLSTSLKTLQVEKTALAMDLAEARKQLAVEKSATGDMHAKLLAEQENMEVLKTRIAQIEETLKGSSVSVLGQGSELVKTRMERDHFAQREQDAAEALVKECQARAKAEKERNAMIAEMNVLKAMLVEFPASARQSASQEWLHSPSRVGTPSVLGLGSSANAPKTPSVTPSKSHSRFGSPSKAAGGLTLS